jgi:hypothetical protein
MIDPVLEYERYLREYKAWLRAYSRRRQSRLQPLIWFERGFNGVLKAFLQIADSFAKAMIR